VTTNGYRKRGNVKWKGVSWSDNQRRQEKLLRKLIRISFALHATLSHSSSSLQHQHLPLSRSLSHSLTLRRPPRI